LRPERKGESMELPAVDLRILISAALLITRAPTGWRGADKGVLTLEVKLAGSTSA
jgi:hypothetical protein